MTNQLWCTQRDLFKSLYYGLREVILHTEASVTGFYQLAVDRAQILDESTAEVKNYLKQGSVTISHQTECHDNALEFAPWTTPAASVLLGVKLSLPKHLRQSPNCQYCRVCHSLLTSQVAAEVASWHHTRVWQPLTQHAWCPYRRGQAHGGRHEHGAWGQWGTPGIARSQQGRDRPGQNLPPVLIGDRPCHTWSRVSSLQGCFRPPSLWYFAIAALGAERYW